MADYKTVQWQVHGRIGRLTLNRPERRNALNPEMLTELLSVLDGARRNQDLNVVVVTGAGPAFCGGVDIKSPFFMENPASDSMFEGQRSLNWQHELIEALYELPQVTIAQVNGNAVGGGGFGLAMACDMRFAVRDAKFWMIPMAVGVVQDFGLTWFLQRACGLPRTMEMVLSGAQVTAEQGEAWGFINRSFANQADLAAHVARLAETIGNGYPDATHLLKQVARNGRSNSLRDQLRLEATANGLCMQSTEFKDAKRQYFEGLRG